MNFIRRVETHRMLSALSFAVVLAIVLPLATVTSQRPSADELALLRARAYATGGLRAAAAVTGTVTRNEGAYYAGSPVDLYQMIGFSQLVVTAWPDSNRSFLTRGGGSVEMHYAFRVESVLKGDLTGPWGVTVVVPGGRVAFGRDSWAEVKVEDFHRPDSGRRYMLFLRQALAAEVSDDGRAASPFQVFEPAFGPLGIFDATDLDAPAIPSGGRNSGFWKDLRRQPLTVRQLVQRVRSYPR